MVHAEITVKPPDVAGALALFAAAVVIDVACLRVGRSTISRWVRHQARHRPAAALTIAAMLALHLALEMPGDPLGWTARMFGKRIALEP